jgi:hypothetical protein
MVLKYSTGQFEHQSETKVAKNSKPQMNTDFEKRKAESGKAETAQPIGITAGFCNSYRQLQMDTDFEKRKAATVAAKRHKRHNKRERKTGRH